MANGHNGGLKKVVNEIREEAVRQIRGFPSELRRQTASGWGQEFARQIFGTSRRRRNPGDACRESGPPQIAVTTRLQVVLENSGASGYHPTGFGSDPSRAWIMRYGGSPCLTE